MPTYDYRCSSTGEVVEVQHRMSEEMKTWGDVCEHTGREPGETAAGTPVEKLITGGHVINSQNMKEPPMLSCGSGGCGNGMCGFNQ